MASVEDVYRRIDEQQLISENATISEILNRYKENSPFYRNIYVIDNQHVLVGLITLREILRIIVMKNGWTNTHQAFSKSVLLTFANSRTLAKYFILPIVYTTLDESVEQAVLKMTNHKTDELPVLNNLKQVIGSINVGNVI